MFVVLVILGGLVTGYIFWYHHRPQPAAIPQQRLFTGITYTREVRTQPIPQVIHVVAIDLTTPELRFFVTPQDTLPDYVYTARTTSQFLQEFGLQLAINGDFFDPWRDKHLFDYYPHEGDGVNVHGLTISQGSTVSAGYGKVGEYATLYITADNHASFAPPAAPVVTAISGNTMLLIDGVFTLATSQEAYLTERHPRTAIGLTQDEQTLLLVVVDGRQPNYSEGASTAELTAILQTYGAYNALNLDGGGSSTLVMAGTDGQPQQLNSPIHNRIPFRERPIANHLGIWMQQ